MSGIDVEIDFEMTPYTQYAKFFKSPYEPIKINKLTVNLDKSKSNIHIGGDVISWFVGILEDLLENVLLDYITKEIKNLALNTYANDINQLFQDYQYIGLSNDLFEDISLINNATTQDNAFNFDVNATMFLKSDVQEVYPVEIREPFTEKEIRSIMDQDIVIVARQEFFLSILEVLYKSEKALSLLDVYKFIGLGDNIWCDEQGIQDLPNMQGDVECRKERYPVDVKIQITKPVNADNIVFYDDN